MSDSKLTADTGYQKLLGRISDVYATGQLRAHQAVNSVITETYWQIGRDIVEFEQGGKAKAEYGKALLTSLSHDLTLRHGKGFSRSNVVRIRQFYLAYPIGATVSHQLSWSVVVELLKIDDALERSFYEQQAIREKWTVRELQRQKKPPFSSVSPPERTRTPFSSSPRRGKSSNSPLICCAILTSSSS